MRWPWQKQVERRDSQPFTDAIVAAIEAQAGGTAAGDPGAIAALETAAGLYARAFAAATVKPESARRIVTPSFLALVGRDMIRRGESLHLLSIQGGVLMLTPVGSWDVRGGPSRASWFYRCDVFGPSGNLTHFVPHDAVIHAQYAVDPARPWHGISPLQWARATGTLAANLEQRLGEEAGGSVGHFLPLPLDGGDDDGDENADPMRSFKADIRSGKGRTLLVESTTGGWGDGPSGAPLHDYKTHRFGADPPATLATLRSDSSQAVLGACGVPVGLAIDADGTGQREAWRRFVMGSVEPVLALVRQELAAKLDLPDLAFDLTPLWAHDGAGRSAMFKNLVAGGVSVNEALVTSGLMEGE